MREQQLTERTLQAMQRVPPSDAVDVCPGPTAAGDAQRMNGLASTQNVPEPSDCIGAKGGTKLSAAERQALRQRFDSEVQQVYQFMLMHGYLKDRPVRDANCSRDCSGLVHLVDVCE